MKRLLITTCLFATGLSATTAAETFRAGAATVDVTPTKFPVIVNGMFNERTADRAHDRLTSRALVLDDGRTRLAIVVVDSLMIPRELLDAEKYRAIGDRLALVKDAKGGRVMGFSNGQGKTLTGRLPITPRRWHHVVLVREN